jgi:hypothetical protein
MAPDPGTPKEGAVLDKLTNLISDEKTRGSAMAVGGMALLMAGPKVTGLAVFAKGVADLEKRWRADHPGFQGDFKARWEAATRFYESTHQDPINRALHMAGIPLILGGAIGLVAMPRYSPPWIVAAASFGAGWVLNIVGHAAFEKNRPAFSDDPLSFVAGPVWDVKQFREVMDGLAQRLKAGEARVAAAPGNGQP